MPDGCINCLGTPAEACEACSFSRTQRKLLSGGSLRGKQIYETLQQLLADYYRLSGLLDRSGCYTNWLSSNARLYRVVLYCYLLLRSKKLDFRSVSVRV